MPDERAFLAATDVARALGVAPSTLRRYLSEGYLPEPGWTRRGRRLQRKYTVQWLEEAARALGLTDELAREVAARVQSLPEAHMLDAPRGLPATPFVRSNIYRISITADLGVANFTDVAAFLAGIDDLYTICYFADTWRAGASFAPRAPGRLLVATLAMASPLHAVGAAKASTEVAKAANATAELLVTAATLGAKRKTAKAEATIAAETVPARIAFEDAQARKAIAEAEAAELDVVQRKITVLNDLAALGERVDGPEIVDAVRTAARELLGPSAASSAIDEAARRALSVAEQARALEASAEQVR